MKWSGEEAESFMWSAVFAIFVLCALLKGCVFS